MIISVLSPHAYNSGNTVTSILTGLGLSELKRRIFLSHLSPQSPAMERYLGVTSFEDKTSTPSQLVKLMREGAIKAEDIGDYCKQVNDFLDVFTNTATNFSSQDMSTLVDYLVTSETPYEYLVFDVDVSTDTDSAQLVIRKSDIVILNLTQSFVELDRFKEERENILKLCKGKKVIMVCSMFDAKVGKSKEIIKYLGEKTSIFPIRFNTWVRWGCNNGKLPYMFLQGKTKDPDVIEIFRDSIALTSAISKAKIAIGRKKAGAK